MLAFYASCTWQSDIVKINQSGPKKMHIYNYHIFRFSVQAKHKKLSAQWNSFAYQICYLARQHGTEQRNKCPFKDIAFVLHFTLHSEQSSSADINDGNNGTVPLIQDTLWKLIIFPEIRFCNASYSLSARPFLWS